MARKLQEEEEGQGNKGQRLRAGNDNSSSPVAQGSNEAMDPEEFLKNAVNDPSIDPETLALIQSF